MNTMENSWQSIADLAQQMHQLASDEDWSGIAKLAMQRHQQVVAHFEQYPVSPEKAEFYQRNLNAFLQQEEQLKQIVHTARKKAIRGVTSINRGRRAVNAYQTAAKPA